jgi:diguanylate cyclase (GGDEF)-like protein
MIARLHQMMNSLPIKLDTQTGEPITQKDDRETSSPPTNMKNQPVPEITLESGEAGMDEPAISDLIAVAEEFHAAFNTALHELDACRKLVKERSARIHELDESIESLNVALNEEIIRTQEKDENHAREADADKQRIHELASERDRLQQQSAEQEKLLDQQAGEISALTMRLEDLTSTLERHEADSLRSAETLAREREEFANKLDALREEYDLTREQLNVLHLELGERNSELAGLSTQLDTLSAEIASLQEAGEQQEEAHRQESGRLQTEIHDLNEVLVAKEELLEHGNRELDSRNSEVASLNDHISELRDELATQSAVLHEQAESHARVCAELKDNVSGIKADYESLQPIHNELVAHAEKLESLNRALHESSMSENDVHKKIVGEKDAAIVALKAKLEAVKRSQDALMADTGGDDALRAALADMQTRLVEAESQARMHADRASLADELEAQVEQLNRELHQLRNERLRNDADGPAVGSLQAQVADLESALQNAKSEHEVLAARLGLHNNLEQEVEHLRKAVKEADDRTGEPPGSDATAASLRNEVERLNWELSASRETCRRLQAELSQTSRESATGEIPARAQDTGLPSLITDRDGFISHLDGLLAEQEGAAARHTLMYVLLDNFIRVRDEIGVMSSEQVIAGIADIIASHCGASDLITRFGDCTFAVLCGDTSARETEQKAEGIRSTVENHIFEVAGRSLITTTSIGVCAIRGSDSGAEQVIARADLACESARLSGGNQVLVNSVVVDELCLPGGNCRHAEIVDRVLCENRIKIYYQPISNLKDNSIKCFEVLIRIVDENRNIILPGEFFAMAVNSGKAREVDLYVIESIMRTLAESGDPTMKLFVKLTGQSVSDHDLPLWIMGKIKEYRVNPGQLVFEIAERILENELKNLSMLSRALSKIGCKIAIEHYRLATKPQHLQHIHTDYIKIDSGLVQNMGSKGQCLTRVTEIMDLARNNGFITIAEGVETPACLAILWELGVGLAQGYLISEPAGNTEFEIEDVDSLQDEANSGKAIYTLG